jgi:hypothetical protein
MGAKLLGRKPHDWSGMGAARIAAPMTAKAARELGQRRPAAVHMLQRGLWPKSVNGQPMQFLQVKQTIAAIGRQTATGSFSCFAEHHPLSERAAAAGIRTIRVVIGRLRTLPSWQMSS